MTGPFLYTRSTTYDMLTATRDNRFFHNRLANNALKVLAKFVIKSYSFSIFSNFERIVQTFSRISLLSNDESPVVLMC